MVDIFVGASKQHFQIHKNLLCTKVEYFKKMFESAFKEGVEQAATLPKDDPDTFALFVQWLYRDSLEPIDISTHKLPEHDVFLDRIRLYGFAEKICLPGLMDYVITTIISSYKHHGRHPTIEAVVLSYQVSAPESPIRSLMSGNFAHYMVTYAENSTYPRTSPDIVQAMAANHELMLDVVKLLRGINGYGTKVSDSMGLGNCKYHTHGTNPEFACRFEENML